MPFDPFGDFDTAGYLRNRAGEKDLALVKRAEHQLFRAQLPTALEFLALRRRISYIDFQETHRILFSGLYPWAGQDRYDLFPNQAVRKGDIYFCDPKDCRKAVDLGLSLAQDKQRIATEPGHIMGLFAFGHPFLDGNGRTMLLVHAELCFRANMSIAWARTQKHDYLRALTNELENPNGRHLDDYLRPFIANKVPRKQWQMSVSDLPGLDGESSIQDYSEHYSDPGVLEGYLEFERRRGYGLG